MSLRAPRQLLSPHEDGYRTPTIEDVGSSLALRERYENPQGRGADASSSASYLPTIDLQSPPRGRASPDQANEKEQTTHLSDKIKLGFRERIKHFTWTWFTMSMATGGVANVIHNLPFRFHGLYAIGCIFFLLNIVLFLFNVIMISLRFTLHPSTFRASFTHPTESLFIPASIVSVGTILMNISQYGLLKAGYWLNTTAMVLFWIYCCVAIIGSCGIYLVLWSTQTFTIAQMTPIWVFPAYPLLIVGPHAGTLSSSLSQSRAFDIIIGGFTLQAIGFMVSLMVYSAFIYRLMTQKLPKEAIRPGMFVSVGPAGFTVSGIVSMAANFERAVPADFMGDGKMAGLTLWFFFISIGAHFSCVRNGGMPFAMTWYSFVFPQTAMVTATLGIGKAFGSRAIEIVGTTMAVLLIVVWMFVFTMNIRAVYQGQILLPQKGEDRDEGGFKREEELQRRETERRRRADSAAAKSNRRMLTKITTA
ncbi:MAG: hypothetical protein M1837_001775 [Sclerophora amabilis]|nr:MAG: hypothetical protein M1837_001775 [Sclerophora amabilis]